MLGQPGDRGPAGAVGPKGTSGDPGRPGATGLQVYRDILIYYVLWKYYNQYVIIE